MTQIEFNEWVKGLEEGLKRNPCYVESESERIAREEKLSKEYYRQVGESNFLKMGIPLRFQKMRIEELKDKVCFDWDIVTDFIESIRKGNSRILVLCGNPGTGKTTLATAILHELCINNVSCGYHKMHKIMQRLEDAKRFNNSETPTEILNEVCTPQVRVLDEIGRFPDEKWEIFKLFDITNEVYENLKSSIYISNMSKVDFYKYLGAATADRFRGLVKTIEFTNQSYRGTEGDL